MTIDLLNQPGEWVRRGYPKPKRNSFVSFGKNSALFLYHNVPWGGSCPFQYLSQDNFPHLLSKGPSVSMGTNYSFLFHYYLPPVISKIYNLCFPSSLKDDIFIGNSLLLLQKIHIHKNKTTVFCWKFLGGIPCIATNQRNPPLSSYLYTLDCAFAQ